jgi:hypothetical protein
VLYQETGKDYIMRSFVAYTLRQILLVDLNYDQTNDGEFWSENQKGRYCLGDLDADARIVLKYILAGCGLDSAGSEQGRVAGSCKHVNM